MVQVIDTNIEIDAPVADVWATFSDFERWPDWNPFVTSLKGRVALGEKLEVRIQPPGGKAMTFKPKVVSFEPENELHWLGHLLLPGVFDGRHQFGFESINGDRTRFTHREEFRGLFVGLLMRMLRDKTTRGFEAMNQALKERVETKSA